MISFKEDEGAWRACHPRGSELRRDPDGALYIDAENALVRWYGRGRRFEPARSTESKLSQNGLPIQQL